MSPDPLFDDADPPPGDVEAVVRTRRVEIFDDCGLLRMVVGELAAGAGEKPDFGVVILDPQGHRRAWLTLGKLGPGLTFDQGGNAGVELGVNDATQEAMHTGAYLVLSDHSGGLSIGWWVEDDGTTTMRTGRAEPPGPGP